MADLTRREELITQCREWAVQCGYGPGQLERGFEALVAEILAGTIRDIELEDGRPERHVIRDNDLGVDVVLSSPTMETLTLAQVKWSNPKKQVAQGEDEVRSFFAKHDALVNPAFLATGSERAQELLGAYPDQIRDGWGVDYYFVTTRSASARIRGIAQSASETFAARGLNVACHFLDLAALLELQRHVREQLGGLHDEVPIRFARGKFIVIEQPRRHLIGELGGRSLRALYKQFGEQLFSYNIRLPLSMQSGKNKVIRQTAGEDPSDFLFYNNGVSAVCQDFSVADNLVTVRKLQIVNGAQTTGAIAQIHDLDAELSVLFRLTASEQYGQTEFIDRVIRFNNTQTPVRDSDFRSNDAIQEFLADALNKYSGKGACSPFFYQHKRGKKQVAGKHRILSFEDLARIRYSYLYDPTTAYKHPSALWTDDREYALAFGIDGVRLDRWSEEKVAETAIMVALTDLADQQAKAGREQNPAFGYLVRLNLWAVGLFGYGLREMTKTYDPVAWAASRPAFESAVLPLVEPAFLSMTEVYDRRLAEKGPQIRPEYNLARDPVYWGQCRALFETKVKGKQIFGGFQPAS